MHVGDTVANEDNAFTVGFKYFERVVPVIAEWLVGKHSCHRKHAANEQCK
jgi:hypothetical protein